ncbi:MAG TPA: ABC-ATPase domain-containing protein [Nitrospiria bacterium]
MKTRADLSRKFQQLDGRGYKAYKEVTGSYDFGEFTLVIDHVQGDPFAKPSRMRIQVPREIAGIPDELIRNKIRRIATGDFLTRRFSAEARRKSKNRGTGNSGLLSIDRPGQQVMERTSVIADDRRVEVRFVAGLPASGRRALGRQAEEMICGDLPVLFETSVKYGSQDGASMKRHVETVEDSDWLRKQLPGENLAAFIPDGAVLPRRSGVDDRPLESGAVAFRSDESLRLSFNRPNFGAITGMGIPNGVTLIVGGGYHGKTTLLEAVTFGVYDHLPGDGREFVVTDPSAVKIRAEDGRHVAGVNISPFINNLPQNRSTLSFWTDNASGSTSQAANIMEALEAGMKLLLIDEDTSATNFMIRDQRMQELIVKESEPITPFIDKVRQLKTDLGVSTILVIGGSGDYFDVADTVIAMESYAPRNVTRQAREIAQNHASERIAEGGSHFGMIRNRIPVPGSLNPRRGRKEAHIKAFDTDTIAFGEEDIDLSAVGQIVHKSQVRAIARALVHVKKRWMDGHRQVQEILDELTGELNEKGLDSLTPEAFGDLAAFRRFEFAAALNRLRTLEVK